MQAAPHVCRCTCEGFGGRVSVRAFCFRHVGRVCLLHM